LDQYSTHIKKGWWKQMVGSTWP